MAKVYVVKEATVTDVDSILAEYFEVLETREVEAEGVTCVLQVVDDDYTPGPTQSPRP